MRGSVCANVNTRIRAETTAHLQSRDMSVMSIDLTLLQRFRQMNTRDCHDIVFFLLYSVFLCNRDDTAQEKPLCALLDIECKAVLVILVAA